MLRRWLLPLTLALPAVLTQWAGWAGALRYERAAVQSGELWRLLSAHLVHLGWMHLALNLAGLALLWTLLGRVLGAGAGALAALVGGAVIGVGLWLCWPGIGWYLGLSGVLHGLWSAGALRALPREPWLGGLLAAALAGKLILEQAGLAPQAAGAWIGGAVIVQAHLLGALGGVLSLALRRPA